MAVARPWKNLIGISIQGLVTNKYNRGADTNIKDEIIKRRFLPHLSAKKPIGKLNNIPASGESADSNPNSEMLAPRSLANKGKTGFLEIVVEKIPKKPIRHK